MKLDKFIYDEEMFQNQKKVYEDLIISDEFRILRNLHSSHKIIKYDFTFEDTRYRDGYWSSYIKIVVKFNKQIKINKLDNFTKSIMIHPESDTLFKDQNMSECKNFLIKKNQKTLLLYYYLRSHTYYDSTEYEYKSRIGLELIQVPVIKHIMKELVV